MKDDFRDFAIRHRGLNSIAYDEYTSQINASYISPSILEERQLNVTQMDVFSRLMMDRIIFLGTEVDDYSANVIKLSCSIWTHPTLEKTSPSTSTLQEEASMQVWGSTTPCNTSPPMYPPSALAWRHQWQPYC